MMNTTKYPIQVKRWGLVDARKPETPTDMTYDLMTFNISILDGAVQKTYEKGEFVLCALVECVTEGGRELHWIRAEELFLLDMWRLVDDISGNWLKTSYTNELPHYEQLLPSFMYKHINSDIVEYNEFITNTHALKIPKSLWHFDSILTLSTIKDKFILNLAHYGFTYSNPIKLTICEYDDCVEIDITSSMIRKIINPEDRRMMKLFKDIYEPIMVAGIPPKKLKKSRRDI